MSQHVSSYLSLPAQPFLVDVLPILVSAIKTKSKRFFKNSEKNALSFIPKQ